MHSLGGIVRRIRVKWIMGRAAPWHDGLIPRWFNKRATRDAFALTMSDAFHWHRACACQPPLADPDGPYVCVSGKGAEGEWAAAWLGWLARTHLEPRGVTILGAPSRRLIEVQIGPQDTAGVEALRRAIAAGPISDEPAPQPPESLWTRRYRCGRIWPLGTSIRHRQGRPRRGMSLRFDQAGAGRGRTAPDRRGLR